MNDLTVATAPPAALPSPYTDRRALSDAWYDALYRRRPGHIEPGADLTMHPTIEPAAAGTPAAPANAHPAGARAWPQHDVRLPANAADVAPDRLLVASDAALFERVTRTLVQRRRAARAAGEPPALGRVLLDIPQSDGRPVRLAVAQNAAQLAVVAVCAPAQAAHVRRSLAQLGGKLAPAGIAFAYEVRLR